jgi:hypothetical protein
MGLALEYDRKDVDYKKAGGAPPMLDHITRTGVIDFDSSYPTGGESLTATMLQLDEILFVSVQPANGRIFQYDYANSKLLAYFVDSGTASDGPLTELADGTDLSVNGADVHFLVVGRVANY